MSSVGYDSDDEGEEAGGIRYTRRNKGKKYAALQNDDTTDGGNAFGNHGRNAACSNGFVTPGHAVRSNGNIGNHADQEFHPQTRDFHESQYTSEESSDIDAVVNSYTRPRNPGMLP